MYDWLYRSTIYRTFLRHRVWAWRTALRYPDIAFFTLFSHVSVWYVLCPTIWLFPAFAVILFFDLAILPKHMLWIQFLIFVAFAPIVLRSALSALSDLSAAKYLMSGKPVMAQNRLVAAQTEFDEWVIAHG